MSLKNTLNLQNLVSFSSFFILVQSWVYFYVFSVTVFDLSCLLLGCVTAASWPGLKKRSVITMGAACLKNGWINKINKLHVYVSFIDTELLRHHRRLLWHAPNLTLYIVSKLKENKATCCPIVVYYCILWLIESLKWNWPYLTAEGTKSPKVHTAYSSEHAMKTWRCNKI